MQASLKQWCRFAGFLAAHAVALVTLYFGLVEPALDVLSSQRQRIAAGVLRLDQLASAAARDGRVAGFDPTEVAAAAQRFMQGSNDGLRNADLLTRLRQAADAAGVSLTSVATLPPRDWSGRPLVGAQVELSASTEGVAKFLSLIEGGSSLLFIRRAKISVPGESELDGTTLTTVVDIYGVTLWHET